MFVSSLPRHRSASSPFPSLRSCPRSCYSLTRDSSNTHQSQGKQKPGHRLPNQHLAPQLNLYYLNPLSALKKYNFVMLYKKPVFQKLDLKTRMSFNSDSAMKLICSYILTVVCNLWIHINKAGVIKLLIFKFMSNIRQNIIMYTGSFIFYKVNIHDTGKKFIKTGFILFFLLQFFATIKFFFYQEAGLWDRWNSGPFVPSKWKAWELMTKHTLWKQNLD